MPCCLIWTFSRQLSEPCVWHDREEWIYNCVFSGAANLNSPHPVPEEQVMFDDDDEYEDEYKHDDIESAHGNLYALFLDGTLCW